MVSRFSWGLTTDITAPDYETRMAILLIKSESSRLEFPSETLSYIAGQIDSNVRELEGALNRVEFVARANGIAVVDIETASQALRSLKNATQQSLSNLTIKKFKMKLLIIIIFHSQILLVLSVLRKLPFQDRLRCILSENF